MNEFMNSYPCDKEMNEENFKRKIHYFLEIIMSKVLNIQPRVFLWKSFYEEEVNQHLFFMC